MLKNTQVNFLGKSSLDNFIKHISTTYISEECKSIIKYHFRSGPSLTGGPGGPRTPHFLGDKVIFWGQTDKNWGQPKYWIKLLIWTPKFQNADEGPVLGLKKMLNE